MPYFMSRKEKWETWGAEMALQGQQTQSSGGLQVGFGWKTEGRTS